MEHNPREYLPRPTDHFFERAPTLLSRLIGDATQRANEDPTLATHEGTFGFTAKNVLRLFQAHFPRGYYASDWWRQLDAMERRGSDFCVFTRVRPAAPDEIALHSSECRRMLGWGYSVGEIVLQLLDEMRSSRKGRDVLFWRRLGEARKRSIICSKGAIRPYVECGWDPADAVFWNPDQSYEARIADPLHWVLAYASPGWFDPELARRRRMMAAGAMATA